MADSVDAERRSAAPGGRDNAPDAERTSTPTAPGGLAVTPDDPARRTALGQVAVQRKAQVGAASDPLEHEADRAADHVMRAVDKAAPPAGTEPQPALPAGAPPGGAPVQRQTAPAAPAGTTPAAPAAAPAVPDRQEDQSHAAAARPVAEHAAEPAGERTQALLDASSGRGEELPASTRLAMESAFGR